MYRNSKSVTSLVIEGENWKCKVYTKHIQDATSVALMSKRTSYEKLINSRSEGEMKQLINNNYKGSEEENNRSKEGEVE